MPLPNWLSSLPAQLRAEFLACAATVGPDRPVYRIRWTRRRLVLWLGAALLIARWCGGLAVDAARDPHGAPLAAGEYKVTEVRADGSVDLTEIVQNSARPAPASPRLWQAVRLLGVRSAGADGPLEARDSTAPAADGGESYQADWLRQRLVGRVVRVELDRRRLAPSGQTLALLFVNDQLVNEELVRSGWARYDEQPGDSSSLQRRLRRAEQEARRARRGVWRRA